MHYYVELRPFPEWQLGKMYPISEDHQVNSDLGEKIPVTVLIDGSGYVFPEESVVPCSTTSS